MYPFKNKLISSLCGSTMRFAFMQMWALAIIMSSFQYVAAQDYFYYYKGRKQPLQLNTEFVYIVARDAMAKPEKLTSALYAQAEVVKFDLDKSTNTLKAITPTATQYWGELQMKSKLSEQAYFEFLKQLKEEGVARIASPYFSNNTESKIGISQYFLVKLKSEEGLSRLEQMARKTKTVIIGQNKFMPLWYTLACTEASPHNALENANQFYESGFFQYAEPDFLTDDDVHANDPQYPSQWGLNNTGLYTGIAGLDINAVNAWEITKGSREIVVAILDHGFEMNHPDLAGNVFGTGFDTESGTTPAQVLGDHATACAGIVAAIQDNNVGVSGVAPNVRLMSVSNSLAGTPNSRQKRADGINWAWQNGAAVISNSWGSGVQYAVIDDAIDNALNNGRGGLGTIVVFSSGNNNGAVGYPANSNPDIIAVGAMSQCGERKSPASCDGEMWGSNFGNELDVVAPGVLISTTDRQGANGYNPGVPIHPGNGGTLVASDFADQNYTIWFNGTSSSCPMVAGVVALILSVNPCLTHDQVEDIIELTAQKVGGYGYAATGGRPNGTWDDEMGYGLVDAEAAVQMAQSMLPVTPIFDLFSKDRPFDTGDEPNPDSGPMYITEDIWVRKNMDGGVTHQNPEYKLYSPNGIYVKVTNRGRTASTCANLSLYFSKASTGLVWPTHWSDYFQVTSSGNILHGDKINTVLIPALAPGASYTVEIPWFPPNPSDFDADTHHFCLLSRIQSAADPMFDEQNMVGVGGNVRRNNNIVWKNVSVYDNDADIGDEGVGLFVRTNNMREETTVNLQFLDRGFKDKLKIRFFERGGAIVLRADEKFMERLKDAKLTDIEVTDNYLYIKSPKATIGNLKLNPKETFLLNFIFKIDIQEGEETLLDVVQQNAKTGEIEGGERFIIRGGKGDAIKELSVKKESSIAYPNPASAELVLKYEVVSESTSFEVTIQNLNGRSEPIVLFKGNKDKGDYEDKFDVERLPKGVYVLTVKIGDRVKTERVVIE